MSGGGGTSLAALLEQSRQLTSNLSASRDIPHVELGLDQIESASRKLGGYQAGYGYGLGGAGAGAGVGGRMAVDGSEEGAHYLLAHGNIDFPLVSRTLNTLDPASAFAPLQPLHDTDIEGHLRHAHEQTIISAIEEGRRSTVRSFYKTMETNMRKDWERQKEQVFEELGRHSAATSAAGSSSSSGTMALSTSRSSPLMGRRSLGPASGSGREAGFGESSSASAASPARQQHTPGSQLQMHTRMMRYDRATRRINEYRKQGIPIGVANVYAEAGTGGPSAASSDNRVAQLSDTWRLVSHIVKEKDVVDGEFQREALAERQYAKAYLSQNQDSPETKELRRMVASGSLAFLEEQFMKHVEKTLLARPTDANLGGIPSVQNKIRAYLNVKYSKMGQWTATNLEMANNQPIWARIFMLLRAGYPDEALAFATENEAHLQRLERSFLSYFKAWLDSPDKRLPKSLRDRFLSEYNQRIRHLSDSSSDPFKYALYKLIGRTEISRRNIPGVTNTTEDWLWVQLMLVRDQPESSNEPAHERFGLQDLAKVLVKFGENHFDPKGQRPLLYFQILLFCGQFERAVAFLYANSRHQVDAVHLGVTLAYYGLLRVPSQAETSDIDIYTTFASDMELYETSYLNFSRMIYRYYRLFAQSDPTEALQYIYLICLNADVPKPVGEEQVRKCHDYIRELVMDTRAYAELLGDVRNDGTKVPGQIEKDLKLIRLANEKEYLQSIVKAAAQRADQEKRFADTILLYNLAEEYDSVVHVLNVALGASLSQPVPAGLTSESTQAGKSVSFGMADDLVSSARSILEHYDRSSIVLHRISKKARETCGILLRLKEAMSLYEQNRLEDALHAIEQVNIVPVDGDLVTILRRAEESKELDEAILRNYDTILPTTMNILYKLHTALKESPYGDASRQQKMNDLRKKARALMMFAGVLRYRLSGETYSHLTRLDVFLH